MVTLSEVAYFARKGINIGAILLVTVVILRVAFNLFWGAKQKYFPPSPPPATVAFGKLPYPAFSGSLATPSGNIDYTVETVDGNLPVLPPTAKVYFMPKSGPSFGSFEKMKAQAAKLGFVDVPSKTGPTSWHFVDKENPLRVLDIDEVSNNFRLTYNYLSDLSLFNEKNFTSIDSLVSAAQSFFDNSGGTPSVSYFRLDAGTLISTTALSNADAVGVTLNRPDLEKIPVVSPNVAQGLVSILFSSSSDNKRKILEARYFYSPIGVENFATYPLIFASRALEQLRAGKAIFASLPTPFPSSIVIRQVYLAYLDPYPPQSFLQPVLVFSDQKGFVAYVPLVSRDYLE